MASAPGLVAVLRIVPLGDNIALGEMGQRVLSASLTPRKVFGGGDARRKLARRASRQTRAVEEGIPPDPCGLGAAPRNPEQPGRDVSQGLGALPRRSLLPKTGKIATQVATRLYFLTASSR